MSLNTLNAGGGDSYGSQDNEWQGTDKIWSDDEEYAYAYTEAGEGTVDWLVANDFSGYVPPNSKVTGIKVRIKRWQDEGGDRVDEHVVLLKTGEDIEVSGSDLADTEAVYTASEEYAEYGSSTELWGKSWSPSDFAQENFRVAWKPGGTTGNTYCDHIQVLVYCCSGGAPYKRSRKGHIGRHRDRG